MKRRGFLKGAALGLPTMILQADESSPPPALVRLYGRTARTDGAAAVDKMKIFTQWTGTGSAVWSVPAAHAEDYEVAVCYASGSPGSRFDVVCGNSRISAQTELTRGLFEMRDGVPESNLNNVERIYLPGTIRLTEGPNEIRLRMTDAKPGEALRLRSLELTRVAAKPALLHERDKALRARASTDWMVKSGYGLMFHWTSQSQPRSGPQKPYRDAVESFSVPKFVEAIQETGAGHVLFTVNHAVPHCPAPIRSWEKYHPGLTTSRDLLGEIATALKQSGIRFLLYINSPRFGKLAKIDPGEFLPGVTADAYVDMHVEVLEEIGRRYGSKLDGYWFDSWYQSFEQYPSIRQDRVFQACKAGNPSRTSAFNFWVLPACTDWQEYWAGEMGSPGRPASARYIEAGAGRGLQHQSLVFLDAPWVHSKPDSEMEAPRLSAETLTTYIRACMEHQGVVTVNLGVFQDGSIGPEARTLMSTVRKAIRT